MRNLKISPKIVALTFGVLTIAFLAAFYVIAWKEPTQVPPGGNADTPINVGTDPQAKAGRISATEFYDYNDPNYYLNPSGQSNLSQLCLFGSCRSSFQWTLEDYSNHIRYYLTKTTYNSGNLGGLSGADAKCANDANKPAGFTSYKFVNYERKLFYNGQEKQMWGPDFDPFSFFCGTGFATPLPQGNLAAQQFCGTCSNAVFNKNLGGNSGEASSVFFGTACNNWTSRDVWYRQRSIDGAACNTLGVSYLGDGLLYFAYDYRESGGEIISTTCADPSSRQLLCVATK